MFLLGVLWREFARFFCAGIRMAESISTSIDGHYYTAFSIFLNPPSNPVSSRLSYKDAFDPFGHRGGINSISDADAWRVSMGRCARFYRPKSHFCVISST
jgi:hypothetical protein